MNEHPHPRPQVGPFAGTIAENYERYFVPAIGRPVAVDLIERAQPRMGERVLDVGCGTGVVTRLAAGRVGASGTAAGLDQNAGMIEVARRINGDGVKIDWYEANADSIPLPDESFDLVLCQMTLQFVTNKLAALREMRRVLAPGGRIAINVPGPTPPPFAAMASALRAEIGPEPAGFVLAVFSLSDPGELRDLLQSAGFRDIDVRANNKRLDLPAPAEFLWQYIQSTPMAAKVLGSPEDRREALEREVTADWQRFVTNGAMRFDVGITTVLAGK